MPSIIIIDDDVDAVVALEVYFEESKIDVLGCGFNGKDAVELYKKHNPDVVLLDLAMPEFDGFYAIKNIQKINPKSKIIILTGSVDAESKKKLVGYQINAIFLKPYKITELATMIRTISKSDQVTI